MSADTWSGTVLRAAGETLLISVTAIGSCAALLSATLVSLRAVG